MLRASPSLTDVTTFQAARPFVIRSSVAKRRATSNGSKYVVEHVEARPSLVVTAALGISTSRGALFGGRGPNSPMGPLSLAVRAGMARGSSEDAIWNTADSG